MEPTDQPNGHVWETCGLSTGSPTSKPKLGASYLKFGLGQGYPGISGIGVSVAAGRSSAQKNLLKVSHSMVPAFHGSLILLALDRHVRNHVSAQRSGAPPNGPVWTSVPFRCRSSSKTKRSRGPHTRRIIAVFPISADPVDIKKGAQLCETVSQPSIQPDKVDPPMGS